MMTSSNGNIFRITGHLCGEFTGHRWIPLTKVTRSFDVFFDLHLNKRLSKQAGDLRRHRAHYDVIEMSQIIIHKVCALELNWINSFNATREASLAFFG